MADTPKYYKCMEKGCTFSCPSSEKDVAKGHCEATKHPVLLIPEPPNMPGTTPGGMFTP